MSLPPIQFGSHCNRDDWPEVNTINGALQALKMWALEPRLDHSNSPHLPGWTGSPFCAEAPCYTFGESRWQVEACCMGYYSSDRLVYPDHPNAVCFTMNFIGYSFGGSIWTDDPEVIKTLKDAIRENMQKPDYIVAATLESAKRAKQFGEAWKGWPKGHPCFGTDADVVINWKSETN